MSSNFIKDSKTTRLYGCKLPSAFCRFVGRRGFASVSHCAGPSPHDRSPRRLNKHSDKFNLQYSDGHTTCGSDPFHAILQIPTCTLLGGIALAYFLVWVSFAPIYLMLAEACQLGFSATMVHAMYVFPLVAHDSPRPTVVVVV